MVEIPFPIPFFAPLEPVVTETAKFPFLVGQVLFWSCPRPIPPLGRTSPGWQPYAKCCLWELVSVGCTHKQARLMIFVSDSLLVYKWRLKAGKGGLGGWASKFNGKVPVGLARHFFESVQWLDYLRCPMTKRMQGAHGWNPTMKLIVYWIKQLAKDCPTAIMQQHIHSSEGTSHSRV